MLKNCRFFCFFVRLQLGCRAGQAAILEVHWKGLRSRLAGVEDGEGIWLCSLRRVVLLTVMWKGLRHNALSLDRWDLILSFILDFV